ncbi:NUDIX hydrolase [Streptomyces sp. 13-12-16]|uniref:NUDIX hydrolase n=1 Tax=Streptomyces sp. 13-12-16 TaxID=1570823 RepID=UPI00277D0C53|nr:NUDIX domain-containing protein [Streptomyces sp. 13-12-16]
MDRLVRVHRGARGLRRRQPVPGSWSPTTTTPASRARARSTLPVTPTHKRSFTVNDDIQVPVPGADEVWTVGAVILDREGRASARKRSSDRRLFPGAWDIVGGHVEEGETLLEALAREVEEETGRRPTHVRRFLGTTTWTGDDGGGLRHEADYLVEVDGGLDHPKPEWSKHSAHDWFGPDDLARLKENCGPGQFMIHDLVARAVEDRLDSPS